MGMVATTSSLRMPIASGPTVPGAPTIGTATGGNANASVAFTAPGNNGGSAITGYTATSTPGSLTGTGATSPINVSGLTNGTAYTFTVHATNAIGNSAESASSNSVTPNASVPDQVTNPLFLSDGTPGTGYVVFPHPAANGSQVTQFEALTSTGVTGVQPRFTLANTNSLFDAQSCRVDLFGLTNVPMTVQVRARNANGVGTYSAASNSITPTVFVDTWVDGANCHYASCGGSIIGLNPLWHDGYFDNQTIRYVAPGTASLASSTVPTVNAPAYPSGVGQTNQLMAELTSQSTGGYGYLVNIFLQNGPGATNGSFNANPYSRFVFYVWPVQAGTILALKTETAYFVEGRFSAVSPTTTTFANQTFSTNTFPAGNSAVIDRTTQVIDGYISNTATVVTNSNSPGLGASIGDYGCVGIGDIAVGSDISDISAFVISPNAGVVTTGAWNRVELPLNASGWNLLAFNGGLHYKWSLTFQGPAGTGTGKSLNYVLKAGFAV